MTLAETINAMAAAGCSAEQIAAVVASCDEARRAKARAGNAERQRRFRQTHNANNGVTHRDEALHTVTERDGRDDAPQPRAPAFFIGEDSNYLPPSHPSDAQPPKNETKQKSQRKRKTALVEDAEPDARDLAAAEKLSADELRAEWSRFRDYHRARGSVMADWHAAWRTWVSNVRRFSPRAGPSDRPRKRTIAEIAHMDEPDEPGTYQPQADSYAESARSSAPGFAGTLSERDRTNGAPLLDL